MRVRKRLAALVIAGALTAPMVMPAAPAQAQLLGPITDLLNLDNLLQGGIPGLLGNGDGVGGLAGVLGSGLLNDLLSQSSLLNQCGIAIGLLDPATCTTGTPTATTGTPTIIPVPVGNLGGLSGLGNLSGLGSLGASPFILPPVNNNQPIIINNNNASTSSPSAAASVGPGGASAVANGNAGSNQSQSIVIP